MYLKKLSVQGFKSFPNRTHFQFGSGVTAIVGPNGSGKSNVTDAVRWVMGEQSIKVLRAKRADDVIFSGGRDRSAVGMAEAILTLDNESKWLPVDFAEVELGRRVYRSGESEYLLNGTRVRLRDLIDLMAKGEVGQNSYSIMGQGLVDKVLSMSSQERRSFLDEAADVKRFRTKIEAHGLGDNAVCGPSSLGKNTFQLFTADNGSVFIGRFDCYRCPTFPLHTVRSTRDS